MSKREITFTIREVTYYEGRVEIDEDEWNSMNTGIPLDRAHETELLDFVDYHRYDVEESKGNVDHQTWSNFKVSPAA